MISLFEWKCRTLRRLKFREGLVCGIQLAGLFESPFVGFMLQVVLSAQTAFSAQN